MSKRNDFMWCCAIACGYGDARYATLVVVGAQRIENPTHPELVQHLKVLKYLISKGLSLDAPDIAGQTALTLSSNASRSRPEFVQALLEAGADVNHWDRYGEIPLLGAMQATNNYREVELMLEHGADIDIPDADGRWCARNIFVTYGPQITAVLRRHINKQEGKEAPRAEKSCDWCGNPGVALRNCWRCCVARYCSADCQRQAWPVHKMTCEPFGTETTATLKPVYDDIDGLSSTSNFARQALGIPVQPTPPSHRRSGRAPKNLKLPKQVIIKVQIPLWKELGEMLVYTKNQELVCRLRRVDAPANYDRLYTIVKNRGCRRVAYAPGMGKLDRIFFGGAEEQRRVGGQGIGDTG